MKVDKTIVDAILNAVEKYDSQTNLARSIGICQVQISKYVTGTVQVISAKTWKKLYPAIAEFLPADYEPAASLAPAEKRSALEQENRVLRERVAYLEGRIDAILEFGGIKKELVQG